MTHDAQHEAFLVQALAQGLSEVEPSLKSRLETCAACAQEWREISQTQSKLEAAGRVQRQVLSQTRTEISATDRARVEQAMRALAARSPATRTRRGPKWLLGLSGLAAAAAIAWSMWRHTPVPAPIQTQPPVLLGDGVQCLEPVGESSAFERFRWSPAEVPPGGYFELSIWTVAADGTSDLIYELKDLSESSWSPPDVVRLAGGRIRWRVELLDPDGQVGSDTKEAWLKRPQ